MDVDQTRGEFHLPRFDLGQVEDVADQTVQHISSVLHILNIGFLLRIQVGVAEQIGHSDHSI